VLLLTCANITHLLLVRTAGRQREMAVRAALGAGRSDLVRLVVAESLILAAAGGVGGALAAVWLKDLLLALDPGILPSFGVFAIDGPVLVFAVLLTGVAGLACSVLPALYGTVAASPARGASLSAKSQAAGAGAWWRRGLLGFEVALSLVLLAGAALLGRALYDLHRVDPGFDPADTYMAYFLLDDADYDEPATRVRFFEELQTAVAAIPGVESAALSTSPPVPDTGIVIDVPYRAEGQAPAADDAVRRAAFRIVTPNYFATLGLPLKAGRDVERFDDADAPDVVVINESLATRLWGGAGEAVGRRLEMDFDGDFRPLEVVGVVGDTRFAGLHRTPRPALFIPHAQLPFRGM
ncbi:MAG: ABC transporter permease, partial [Acidobacteriota bacterium]